MGSGSSQPQFQQSNLVIDSEFAVQQPDPKPYQIITEGPASHKMDDDVLDEIQLTINRILIHGDRANAISYKRYLRNRCWCHLLTISFFLTIPIIWGLTVLLYGLDFVDSIVDYYYEYRKYTLVMIAGVVGLCLCQWYCYFCTTRGAERAKSVWRRNVISIIDEQIQEFQSQWPQFVFTLIYPLHVRVGKVNVIRGRIRVTLTTNSRHTPIHTVQRIEPPVAGKTPNSELTALNPQPVFLPPHNLEPNNAGHRRYRGQDAILHGQRIQVVTDSMVPLQVVRKPKRPLRPKIPISTDHNHAGYHSKIVEASA